jgi:hypothetical protein
MVQIKMLSSGKETKGEEEKCARHGEKSGTRAENKECVARRQRKCLWLIDKVEQSVQWHRPAEGEGDGSFPGQKQVSALEETVVCNL